MSEDYHDAAKEAQSEFYIRFGENIRIKRKQINLTQEDLAWLLNISRVSINNIEAGKQRPPLHFIVSICAILKLTPTDVIPNYNYGIKSIDELKLEKAKRFKSSFCNHESMELITALDNRKFYICHQCGWSKPY